MNWATVTHSPECAAEAAAISAARDAWAARWPNHCTVCEGKGWEGGPGVDHWGEANGDICFACVGEAKCPRCGMTPADAAEAQRMLLGYGFEGPCAACGWTGKGDDDIMPPRQEPYCDCEIQAMRDAGDI